MEYITGLFSNLFVASASLTLIHFVWQGALVAFLLRIALAIIPQNKPTTRYRTSIAFLLAIVALPIYTFSYLYQSPDVVKSTINYSVETISSIETISPEIPEHSADLTLASTSQNGDLAESKAKLKPIAAFVVTNNQQIMQNILWLWLAGFVFMAIKFVLDLTQTFGLTKKSVMPVDSKIEEIVQRFSTICELQRPVQILKSSIVNVPIVVGWLKPVILLPIAITIGLEKKQLELIIAHEMAHIKRTDFLVNLMQNLIHIGFFYHPSVHWINRVIRDEREFICDSMALEMVGMSAEAKLNLAKALLNTEEMSDGNLSLMAVALSGGKLKGRIAHILGTEYRPATSIRGLVVGFITFSFSLAAMASTMAFDSNETNLKSFNGENLLVTGMPAVAVKRKRSIEVKNQNKVDHRLSITPLKDQSINTTGELDKNVLLPISKKKSGDVKARLAANSQTTNLAESAKKSAPKQAKKTLIKEDLQAWNALKKPSKTASIIKQKNLQKSHQKPDNKIEIAKIFLESRNKLEAPIIKFALPDKQTSKQPVISKSAALDLSSVKSFRQPKAIFTPYPEYPRRAWNRMIDLTVKVEFDINEQGKVKNIKTVGRVDKDFAREIRRKLIKWRYEPAITSGKIVQHKTAMEFVFEAPQKEKVILTTTGSRIRRL